MIASGVRIELSVALRHRIVQVSKWFEDNVAKEGLGQQSVRGGAISLFARAIMAVGQVGSVLFLARLLTPEDYGLVAMVTAFVGFAPVLVDLGTRDAIVQRPQITEGEVSALFWVTIVVGFISAICIAASGPLIAWFYGEPRLESIAGVSALTFIAASCTSQHQALLRRAVRFRDIAIIEVAAHLLSGFVAITMAYRGLGYWALVTRPLIMYCFITIGVWSFCRWVPGRPVFTSGVKSMLGFGLNSTGFSIADFVGKNCDKVAIGRGLGARTLGYYQNALFIYDNLIDILVAPLHQIAVASLSKLQDRPDELKVAWSKALSTVAFYAMPAFGILAVTSQDLIVLVLGKKWESAGLILSILGLRGIPHTVERTLGWLHVTAGRTDRWMRWGAFAMCTQLVALVCGLPFGPSGVAVAYVLIMFVLFVPAIAYAGQPFRIGARDVIKTVGPQLTGSLIAACVGFALRNALPSHMHGIAKGGVLALVYVTLYCGIVIGVFELKTPLRIIASVVCGLLPSRWTWLAGRVLLSKPVKG
jgi:polysaccharide transporter, PST family